MTEELLDQLENNINQDRRVLENIESQCEHMKLYKESHFQFLPGHRHLILTASPNVETQAFKHPAFSPLLQNLIQVSLNNYEQPKNRYRYTDLITNFATYTHINAGKAFQEVMAANLSVPTTSAICNYFSQFYQFLD